MPERRFWLFKSEPQAYSFEDLMNEEGRRAEWDGVRNYQARNLIRDDMQVGDRVLFYHSSSGGKQVVGTATIVREGYPDFTALNPQEKHHDSKSTPDNPVWYMVDIRGDQALGRPVSPHGHKGEPRPAGHDPGQEQPPVGPAHDPRRVRRDRLHVPGLRPLSLLTAGQTITPSRLRETLS